MSPAKLFDYLDGKLNDWERRDVEAQLEKDPHLQKELAAARRIHSGMHGGGKEVAFQDDPATLERGRKMSLRVGVAFVVLMAVNVAGGLLFIAHHEATNPNKKLLADQARKQLEQSLRDASKTQMPTPTLDIADISVLAPRDGSKAMVAEVTSVAHKAGGESAVALPDGSNTNIIIDIPAEKEADLCRALNALPGVTTPATVPEEGSPDQTGSTRVIVHVTQSNK